ncbi:MAG: DUF4476 domain-containing protein [Chitinophagaceae bacterium]
MAFFIPALAQQHHYLFLQSDAQQGFYVRYEGRMIVCGSGGYVLLSKLKEERVKIGLGFSAGNIQELNFEVPLNKQDKGYIIKQFGDNGWGLFDVQTADIIYALAPSVSATAQTALTNEVVVQAPTNDAFSEMLSQVTKDSTVKQVAVLKPAVPKPAVTDPLPRNTQQLPEPAAVIAPKQSEAAANSVPVPKPVEVPVAELLDTPVVTPVDPVVVEVPTWKPPVKSVPLILSKVQSSEGIDVVVVDRMADNTDTIYAFIAQPKKVLADTLVVPNKDSVVFNDTVSITTTIANTAQLLDTMVVAPVQQMADTSVLVSQKQEPQETKEPAAAVKEEAQNPVVQTPVQDTVAAALIMKKDTTVATSSFKEDSTQAVSILQEAVNTPKKEVRPVLPAIACKGVATEDDFVQLRKKMVLAKNEAAMVEAAKKGMGSKCYTVAQMQLLSFLFLSDEWRYRFYDAVMLNVADYANFETLENNLTDPNYKKRFRALLPGE